MQTDTLIRTDLSSLFVPVIFANGEDDDTPGLVAMFANESVQFDDTIFRPDEDISITGRCLCQHKAIKVIHPRDHSHVVLPSIGADPISVVRPAQCRHVTLHDVVVRYHGPE